MPRLEGTIPIYNGACELTGLHFMNSETESASIAQDPEDPELFIVHDGDATAFADEETRSDLPRFSAAELREMADWASAEWED